MRQPQCALFGLLAALAGLLIGSCSPKAAPSTDWPQAPSKQPDSTVADAQATVTQVSCYVLSEDKVPDFQTIGTLGGGFVISDLSNDGLSDLIYAGPSLLDDKETGRFHTGEETQVRVVINDGTGSFIDGTSIVIEGTVPGAVLAHGGVAADFNGDGYNDVFFGDHGRDDELNTGRENILLLSDADGHLVDASGQIQGRPCNSHVPQYQDAPICGGTDQPLYEAEGLAPPLPDATHSVAAGDIDSDGDIDIFVGSIGFATPYFLINDGSGSFMANWAYVPAEIRELVPGLMWTKSELADLDGDGHPDLILGGGGPTWQPGEYGYSMVIWNTGSGDFSRSEKTELPTVAGRTYQTQAIWDPGIERLQVVTDIATLDVDSDGDLDILLSYGYSGRYIQLLVNQADRSFVDETAFRFTGQTIDAPSLERLVGIDFNEDNAPDVLAVHTNNDPDEEQIWINNGRGYFSLASFAVTGKTGVLMPLDAHGDGGLDFLVLNSLGGATQYHVQDFSLLTNQRPCTSDEIRAAPPNPDLTPTPFETPYQTPQPSSGMPTPSAAEYLNLEFRDDFEDKLEPGWRWIREDREHWSLSELPGYLRIILPAQELGAPRTNFLLRAAPDEAFEIEAKVLFTPSSNFQMASILIYQDDENFLRLAYAYCDLQGVCVGDGIYFDKEISDQQLWGNFATETSEISEAYLRLRRDGATFTAFFSEDGSSWSFIGQHTADFESIRVGLFAGMSSDIETADFDFFTIKTLSP